MADQDYQISFLHEDDYSIEPSPGAGQYPLVITPEKHAQFHDFKSILANNKQRFKDLLKQHGALLFRDFEVRSAEQFRMTLELLDVDISRTYPFGISPRTSIIEGVFTSTEVHHFVPIAAHNEMSYLNTRPGLIAFFCLEAPEIYGETPIFDAHSAYKALRPEIQELLSSKRLRYFHYYKKKRGFLNDETEKIWPDLFLTEDKQKVEKLCEANGFKHQWFANDAIGYQTTTPSIVEHPETGECCLNLHLLHWYTIYRYLKLVQPRHHGFRNCVLMAGGLMRYISGNFPLKLSFEDGSKISQALANQVHQAQWDTAKVFKWKKNDILVLDNIKMQHGRLNVVPPRKILTSFGNMYTQSATNSVLARSHQLAR